MDNDKGMSKNIFCHYFHKKGHMRNMCEAYKMDRKKATNSDSDSDTWKDIAEGSDSDTSCDVHFSDVKLWKIDSDANFHILAM